MTDGQPINITEHSRSWRPSYKLGNAGWIHGTEKPSMSEALAEIKRWREEHGFNFEMRVVQTKTTHFHVA